jgi:hypothetical protein
MLKQTFKDGETCYQENVGPVSTETSKETIAIKIPERSDHKKKRRRILYFRGKEDEVIAVELTNAGIGIRLLEITPSRAIES